MNKEELESLKKQISGNENIAIKLIKKVSDYKKLLDEFERFLEELEKEEDFTMSMTAIGIHKRLIELKMGMITQRGEFNE